MKIRPKCLTCGSFFPSIEILKDSPVKLERSCSSGHKVVFHISESIKEESLWEFCPVCENPDSYLSKDVPKKVFLGSLIIFLGISLYLLSVEWVLGIGLLFALAAMDLVLYRTLPDLLVCYGCGSEARKFVRTEDQRPYDPHVGERYRQQKLLTKKQITST